MSGLTTPIKLLILTLMLVGCNTMQTAPPAEAITAEAISSLTPTPIAQAQAVTPTIAPTTTPQEPVRLVIWWPEPLSPLDNGDAADLLSQQISAFQAAQGNVDVQLRLKTETGLGGILSTLKAANPVAPGALPDLTLMRRADLLAAVQSGLVYPLENNISTDTLNNLYDAALQLAQINDQLYGLPYMLEVQHMAYNVDAAPPSSRFDALLNAQTVIALPVAQADQINGVLLSQYLSAGGTLTTAEGFSIHRDALLQTLTFYQTAMEEGLIDPAVLSYNTPADYRLALVGGTLDGGVISSTVYLNLLSNGEELTFGAVPTQSGEIIGEMNGWVWVMTTSSPERQALAARFLTWMMDTNRQAEYSQTINMIPSQRGALQQWENTPYSNFIQQVLENMVLPLSDNEGGGLGRAVQNALVSVLSGETTASSATDALMARYAG